MGVVPTVVAAVGRQRVGPVVAGPLRLAARPLSSGTVRSVQSDSVQRSVGGDLPGSSGPTPRRSERVAVVLASFVLFAVLIGGFARLAGVLGLDDPVVNPPPTLPSSTLPSSGVASATGSVLPADPGAAQPSPTGSLPSPSVGAPGVTPPVTSVPASGSPSSGVSPSSTTPGNGLPPRWPVSLPDPGEHRLLGIESEEEDRWLLAVPGNVPLAGGRFVAGLEELDWEVGAVSTPRTLTAVGTRGDERVSVTLRPGGDGLPAGWLLLDVVYQPTIPEFETPPSSSIPPEDEVTKRS